MSKIKSFFKNMFNYKKIGCTKKQLIIFYIVLIILVAFVVIGITLTFIGNVEYGKYVSENVNAFKTNVQNFVSKVDISLFIYGIFSIINAILFFFIALIYGNSLFNKKLKAKEENDN